MGHKRVRDTDDDLDNPCGQRRSRRATDTQNVLNENEYSEHEEKEEESGDEVKDEESEDEGKEEESENDAQEEESDEYEEDEESRRDENGQETADDTESIRYDDAYTSDDELQLKEGDLLFP